MKKTIAKLSIVSCLLVALTGCMSPPPPQEGKLYVRTLIDGKDTLYIRGDTMWFEHGVYQLPGRWAGQDLPTYINEDQQWIMEWNGSLSDVVTFEDPAVAIPTAGAWNSENMRVKFYTPGYGEASVLEYPTPENDHSLVIMLDDVDPDGAHWYYIDIDWDETAN